MSLTININETYDALDRYLNNLQGLTDENIVTYYMTSDPMLQREVAEELNTYFDNSFSLFTDIYDTYDMKTSGYQNTRIRQYIEAIKAQLNTIVTILINENLRDFGEENIRTIPYLTPFIETTNEILREYGIKKSVVYDLIDIGKLPQITASYNRLSL